MGIDREIESTIADQDITSGAAYGSYQNTSGATQYVSAELRLSKLTNTAATITSGIQKFTAGDALLGENISSNPKFLAANTVFSIDPNRVRLGSGEKLKVWVESSNSSDDNALGAATGPDIDIVWTDDLGLVATEEQVGALSIGAAGLSVNADSVNVTTGNETNSVTDTTSAGVIHIVEDAGGITLFEYVFDLSEFTGTATNFLWTGYIQSNNDEVDVQYYDEVAEGWKTLVTLPGSNGTSLVEHDFDVPVNGTGVGANFGRTRLRFSSTITTAIGTDRVRCVFSQAEAGIKNGSTITLDEATINKNFRGNNWTLALENQDISGSFFSGAHVTGLSSASSEVTFEDCTFGVGSYPPGHYRRCGIGDADGRFTGVSAGDYHFDDCKSAVAAGGTPDFTFAGSNVHNRGWLGGVDYTLDATCMLSHEVLAGGTTTVNTNGAEAEVRGTCRSVTFDLSSAAAGLVQFVGITGPITITESSVSTAVVNLYGISSSLTNTSSITPTDETNHANVQEWLGTAVATPNTAGIPSIDVVLVNGSERAAESLAARNYSNHPDGVVVVSDAATDILRAAELRTAYDAAVALTPGGNALAANNRATVLIPPGRYDFALGDVGDSNHGLKVATEFVDLIGMGAVETDVCITSQIATASRGTVEQTADDVEIRNLWMDIDSASSTGSGDTEASAYFPADNLPLAKLTDVKCSAQQSGTRAMRTGIEYSGTYNRVTGGDSSFGGGGTASGTFTNCTGGSSSFGGGTASGTFTNCTGGDSSFGSFGTASGTFTNCTGGSDSFGGFGMANGTFTNCTSGGSSFGGGGTASGTFTNCTGGGSSFELGSAAVYTNCTRDGVFLHNGTLARVTLVDTTNVNTDTAAWYSGITSLASWLGLMAGKQAADATARTEMRVTGAGSGTFDETTDSLEANAEAVDALSPATPVTSSIEGRNITIG